MEALALFVAPTILHHSYLVLTIAWQQYNTVQERKKQCQVLIQRCQDLLLEVNQQMDHHVMVPSTEKIEHLERACTLVKDAILYLARKSFAWRLLHQDQISQSFAEAEHAVMDALSRFNLGAHLDAQRLQIEIAEARKDDHSELVTHLKSLEANDQRILEALQVDGQERRRLEELVIALTKHVRTLATARVNSREPTDAFIRTASGALHRLSRESTTEFPQWTLTSLEVQFDREDADSKIGVGGFGDVYRGEWFGQLVAVKEMNSADARTLNRSNLAAIRQEIDTWSRLRHPNILPFYGACLEAFRPFIVSRLCQYGNALNFLRAHPTIDRISILYDVALGMLYLHNQGLIHADLKAANILIGDDERALIADFGSSRFHDQIRSQTHSKYISAAGTLRWLAPELLDGEPLDKPADLYSFGITIWEIFTEKIPFGDVLDDRVLARKVVDKKERPPRPDSISDPLWNLVQQCWNPEPSARPTFQIVLAKLKPILSSSYNSPRKSLRSISDNASESSNSNYYTSVNDRLNTGEISPLGLFPNLENKIRIDDRGESTNSSSSGQVSDIPVSPYIKRKPPPSLSGVSINRLPSHEEFIDRSSNIYGKLDEQRNSGISLPLESSKNLDVIPREYRRQSNSSDYSLQMSDRPDTSVSPKDAGFKSEMNRRRESTSSQSSGQAYGKYSPGIPGRIIPRKSPTGIFSPDLSIQPDGSKAGPIDNLTIPEAAISQRDIDSISSPGNKETVEHVLDELRVLEHWVSKDDVQSISSIPELRQIQQYLLESGRMGVKEHILSNLITLSKSAVGRKALQAQPKFLTTLITLLSDATPPINIMSAQCLANLAIPDDGNVLLAQPNLFSVLTNILQKGSAEEREPVSECLCNLTLSSDGVSTIIAEPHLLRALGNNLMYEIPEKLRESIITCYANVTSKREGAKALFSMSDSVDTLVKLLSNKFSIQTQENAARCFAQFAAFDERTHKFLVSRDVGLLNALKKTLQETLYHVDTYAPGQNPFASLQEQILKCLAFLSKSKDNHPSLIKEGDLIVKLAMVSRSHSNVRTVIGEYGSIVLLCLSSSVEGRKFLREKRFAECKASLTVISKYGSEKAQGIAKNALKNLRSVTTLFALPS